MKRIIIIILLILSNQIIFSQDWNPFVKDQINFYKQQHNNGAMIESFIMDSVLIRDGKEYFFFNTKTDLSDECYENLKQELGNEMNPNKLDSLVRSGDSILFIRSYYDRMETFIFKPYCKTGDIWTTNNITIKCTEMSTTSIFGIEDSIKVFECMTAPYDTIQFILSKTLGFIKFLPFNEFILKPNYGLPPLFELIGITNHAKSIGFTIPDFSEYFHLNVNDILFWKYDFEPVYMGPEWTRYTNYYIDTIKHVFISNDSIYFYYNRTIYNENGQIEKKYNESSYYLRKYEGFILQNRTSWFGLLSTGYADFETYYLNSYKEQISNDDTLTFAKYTLFGIFIDTNDCIPQRVVDGDIVEITFSTREGMCFKGVYGWGFYTTDLIGSIINGKNYGTIYIPTNINNHEFKTIKIYPIPMDNQLTISAQNKQIQNIELFDIQGNLIISQIYFEIIDTEHLKPGIYILRIINLDNTYDYFKILRN